MTCTRASLIADCHRKQRDFATDITMHELLANCEEQMAEDAATIDTMRTAISRLRSSLAVYEYELQERK